MELPANILRVYLDAAPWLLFGLLAAGCVKAWMPAAGIQRWLGGRGAGPAFRAALIGAPLPICSCGVLPMAVGLRRAGASREATVSFMISTPETGVDSVILSYAMLGPFMAIARPLAAVTSAVFTGMLTALAPGADGDGGKPAPDPCCDDGCAKSADETAATGPTPGFLARTMSGMRFAMTEVLDDIAPWLAVGLVLAGFVVTFVPPQALAAWGSGPGAMAVMLVVGIPMYICATASTPLAASLLLAGVSPGAVMVFLLAGPATNVATVAVVRMEMGTRVAVLYLLGIAVSSIAAGLAVDALAGSLGIDVAAQLSASGEAVPAWIAATSGVVLGLLALRPLYSRLAGRLSTGFSSTG